MTGAVSLTLQHIVTLNKDLIYLLYHLYGINSGLNCTLGYGAICTFGTYLHILKQFSLSAAFLKLQPINNSIL
jgi:hypothetical protein